MGFRDAPVDWVILAVSFAFLIYGTIGTIKLARRAAAIRRQAVAGLQASSSSRSAGRRRSKVMTSVTEKVAELICGFEKVP